MLKKPVILGIILLFLIASLIPLVSSGTFSFNMTIYVDDDNKDGPWDGSMEHPYQHIQDAVDNAPLGSTALLLLKMEFIMKTSLSTKQSLFSVKIRN